jgi:hypothetical protein
MVAISRLSALQEALIVVQGEARPSLITPRGRLEGRSASRRRGEGATRRLASSVTSTDGDTLADAPILMLEVARVSRQTMGPDGLSSKFVVSAEAVIAAQC